MLKEKIILWEKEEYTYPVLGTFIPNIVSYVHDEDDQIRPSIIVTPGGAYCFCSSSEGEIVAKEFYDRGYNCFVLTYTTDFLMQKPLMTQPIRDMSRAIRKLRLLSEKYRVDTNKLAVMGFSAGGHLCGSIATHFDDISDVGEYAAISNRPDACILCYPVISTGKFTHENSRTALCGDDIQFIEYMSLEKQVKKNTPPTFLWHCMTDTAVPVDNSLLFAEGCRKNDVPVEMHLFDHGHHGMSVATEAWAHERPTGNYTLEQFFDVVAYLRDNGMQLPDPFTGIEVPKDADIEQLFLDRRAEVGESENADDAIHEWVELSDKWLTNIYS